MRLNIQLSSSVTGRIDFKKSRSRMNALKVESSMDARFHGLRPQVRLTRITPSDHTSFAADE